jgi:hypothetical protein
MICLLMAAALFLISVRDGPVSLEISDNPAVRINEIMYAPPPGEPEWVEIVNADSTAVNLSGWSITDAAVGTRHLIAQGEALIGPGERWVLTKDSAALAIVRYRPPWRVLSVPAFPSLNNTGDVVVLFRKDGRSADSVGYRPSWGGSRVSLERRDPTDVSDDSSNWGSCLDPSGGTPGRVNSIARMEKDVALVAGEGLPGADGRALLRAHVVNRGRDAAVGLRVTFYEETLQDGVRACGERIGSASAGGTLAAGDSILLAAEWSDPPAGNTAVIAAADAQGEERRENDTLAFVLCVSPLPGSVVVNEIMFAPLAGEPEYLELYNAGDRPISLGSWRIRDRTGGTLLEEKAPVLSPGEFAVITGDSSLARFFPRLAGARALIVPRGGLVSLNNDGDDVVLRDPSGRTVDSVAYSPTWHSPAVPDASGRSLERILARGVSCAPWNWSTCTLPGGGTPGEENSVALAAGRSEGVLTCSPNPFSPDGDGREDATVIHFALPPGAWSSGIDIYDVRGRLIRHLVSAMAGEGDLLWDGRDDLGRRGRIGLYAVVMEGWDTVRGTCARARTLVVLAGAL